MTNPAIEVTTEALRHVVAAGLLPFLDLSTVVQRETESGRGIVNAIVPARRRTALIDRLRRDRRFIEGPFWWLHRNSSAFRESRWRDLTEFRSHPKAFGDKGSMQIVLDTRLGIWESDVDRYAAYSDVAGSVGHIAFDVVGSKLLRAWRKVRD